MEFDLVSNKRNIVYTICKYLFVVLFISTLILIYFFNIGRSLYVPLILITILVQIVFTYINPEINLGTIIINHNGIYIDSQGIGTTYYDFNNSKLSLKLTGYRKYVILFTPLDRGQGSDGLNNFIIVQDFASKHQYEFLIKNKKDFYSLRSFVERNHLLK